MFLMLWITALSMPMQASNGCSDKNKAVCYITTVACGLCAFLSGTVVYSVPLASGGICVASVGACCLKILDKTPTTPSLSSVYTPASLYSASLASSPVVSDASSSYGSMHFSAKLQQAIVLPQ